MTDQQKAGKSGADALEETQAKAGRISTLADRLRRMREENHFAEIIDRALIHPPKGTP